MEGKSALNWRKPSRSGNNGGNCVEAASTTGAVLVRDTNDRAGAVLSVPAEAWQAFADGLK